MESTRKSGKRSLTILEIPSDCWCARLRIVFLLLTVSAMFVFYYVNLIKVPSNWSDTIQRKYNSTDNTLNVSASASTEEWTSILISESETSDSPSAFAEVCSHETKYLVPYPCQYRFILNESKRCKNDNPFLVLMVPVAPHNRKARDAVRNTWGSEKVVKNKVVRLFFLLGLPGPEGRQKIQQKILQESEEHHDIIQSNFLDSYKNLTIKTMMIMEWLATYCQNASYAMKIDSDMFLNLNTLMYMLLRAPTENYMTGLVVKGATVLRDTHSKWFLPKDVFPEDLYPPYALGLGYVISLDLTNKLLEGSKDTTPIYIEDVFLGLCMRHLGIQYTIQYDESLFNVIPVPYERCRYSKLIATTTRSQKEQLNSWKDLKKPGPLC